MRQQASLTRRATRIALISFGYQEVLELPRVAGIQLRLVIAAEEVRVMLERSPVRGNGDKVAEVRFADAEDKVVRQVVGNADAAARVVEHPQAGGDHGNGDLHGGGVLMRHEPPRLGDAQV